MDEIQVAVFRWPGPEAHPTPGKKDRVCRTVVRRLACLLSFILSAVPALTAQSFDERFSRAIRLPLGECCGNGRRLPSVRRSFLSSG